MAIKTIETLLVLQQGQDELRVTHDQVNGKDKIQIRIWYTDENGVRQAGRQGLTITPENFQQILKQVKVPAAILNGAKQ